MHLHLPIEQLVQRLGTAFQFGFATEAKELLPEGEEFLLNASHRGLHVLARNEEALALPRDVLLDVYGPSLRIDAPRVRLIEGVQVQEPIMHVRISLQTRFKDPVKGSLLRRGAVSAEEFFLGRNLPLAVCACDRHRRAGGDHHGRQVVRRVVRADVPADRPAVADLHVRDLRCDLGEDRAGVLHVARCDHLRVGRHGAELEPVGRLRDRAEVLQGAEIDQHVDLNPGATRIHPYLGRVCSFYPRHAIPIGVEAIERPLRRRREVELAVSSLRVGDERLEAGVLPQTVRKLPRACGRQANGCDGAEHDVG